MRLYQTNCASCHGDLVRPDGMFAQALYPRAPQFMKDSPDMPENQNFYIIQHGVRLSGMPAWGKILNQQQVWQLTTFLAHMDKLPPEVTAQWRAVAQSGSDPGQ
jgi:mono/diheme cytochrome c family protein